MKNDQLYGGIGSDTYIWGVGSGNDTIYNYMTEYYGGILSDHGQDTVQLGANLTMDSFNYLQIGSNLVLQNKTTNETLTILGWFNGATYQVEKFQFADGTMLTSAQVDAMAAMLGTDSADSLYGLDNHNDKIYGQGGNDTLNGYSGNDVLDGGTGNDTLSGVAGNDVLDGGTGNDQLYGGSGSDTYIWGVGSGNDTIYNYMTEYYGGILSNHGQDTVQLGANLTMDSFNYLQIGSDLALQNKTTNETLTISGWFNGAIYQVENFQFADGTMLTSAQVSMGTVLF